MSNAHTKERLNYHWALGFFGLPQGYNVFLHVEIWNLVYHGKFSHTDAYNLPIHLRKFYTRKLKAEADKTQESPTGDPGYSPLNKDGTIKK